MNGFINLCTTLISGCAEFFELPFPGLGGITFFQILTGLFLTKASIVALKLVFGIDHGKDEV